MLQTAESRLSETKESITRFFLKNMSENAY